MILNTNTNRVQFQSTLSMRRATTSLMVDIFIIAYFNPRSP